MEGWMLLTLVIVVALTNLVCWVSVLVAMFRTSVITGLAGFFCGLYAFIWGWSSWQDPNKGTMMTAWTICVLIGAAFRLAAGHPGPVPH